MIMPFTDEHFEVYEMLKKHFADEFEFTHAGDDVDTQQNILKDIIQMIYDSDVIIADLSGLNANVFYELGVAHTLAKKVINITQNLSQLPFDIKSYRTTEYSTHFKKFDFLVKELTRYLNGAINGTVAFGNPVTDFLTTKDEKELAKVLFRGTQQEELPSEKGFIDYLADIEEESAVITDALVDLTTDMNTMSTGIEQCTNEMERVQKTGGSGTASFMKKQARKAANLINTYSLSQRKNNNTFNEKWPSIEHSCLLLIENKHIDTPENREGLVSFLKTLHSMKVASLATYGQVQGFLEGFTAIKGIQSSLNQAVSSLEIDIKQFLCFIEQMCASIDRIHEKSKFVVGIIDYTDMPIDDTEEASL